MNHRQAVFQFRVELHGVDLPVWRRIQLPDTCTFWDLHMVIQDAMGWLDRHIHHFEVYHAVYGKQYLGLLPEEAIEDEMELYTLPGWAHEVEPYLSENPEFIYEYDCNAPWRHRVVYEGLRPQKPQWRCRPICLAGAGACPPEEVGGPEGYRTFLAALEAGEALPEEVIFRIPGGADRFDPAYFNSTGVKFDTSRWRWRRMLKECGLSVQSVAPPLGFYHE